ncbi:hypothetical protein PM082_006304 [Marasmius tenuissimus]|nr:hypothetical protein PM082_006304 [Marasmius tenuissimus]
MTHLELECTGNCLSNLAAVLDLHDPAGDVPHGSLTLHTLDSEVLFALTVRATPNVIEVCRCPFNVPHRGDLLHSGHRLTLRQWDTENSKCGCPEILYSWDASLLKCIWAGLQLWIALEDGNDKHIEEMRAAVEEGGPVRSEERLGASATALENGTE